MKHFKRNEPRKRRTVLLLIVAVKWDIELCGREIMQISRRLHGWPFKPSMHSNRLIAYVIQTSMTSRELMDSLGDTVHAGCIENAWCLTAGSDAVNIFPLDPLADAISSAFESIRKWNNPDHMRAPKAGDIFRKRGIKDGERNTAVKMSLQSRPVRNSPQKTNKP